LGTEIQSETIDGSKVKFNLSEITKDGHMLKLTGKGMRNVRMPSHRGNHYITIKYKYPNNLSEKQIELLKEFNEIEKNK
jgi:molecular chaperone DnaJ